MLNAFAHGHVFKRHSGEQNVTVQKNRPRATLFNLMLTACDVVICHLLMDNTGPNCTKGKTAVKGEKYHDLHCCFLCFSRREKKNKDNCLFLPFFNSVSSPARRLQHTLVSTDTGRSAALSVFSKSISLTQSSQAPYSLSPHYSKKYDFLTATSLSL